MARNPLIIVGVILVVLGAGALIVQNITYTEVENVVDVGGVLNVSTEKEKRIPVPPILGGIALAAGAVCIALGVRKK